MYPGNYRMPNLFLSVFLASLNSTGIVMEVLTFSPRKNHLN